MTIFFFAGIDFKIRTIELDGKKIKLQIWDTAGQERFRTITTAYYRGAMGIMLVYDITNEKSFDNIKNWIRNIEEHASADVEKMILGNKCDMNDRRQVSWFGRFESWKCKFHQFFTFIHEKNYNFFLIWKIRKVAKKKYEKKK